MSKSFADYAAKRLANMDADGQLAAEVFDRAMAFGSTLAAARRERRLSQTELAKLCGVTQADISRIERGVLSPTSTTVMRITEALQADLQIKLRELV